MRRDLFVTGSDLPRIEDQEARSTRTLSVTVCTSSLLGFGWGKLTWQMKDVFNVVFRVVV